MRARAAEDRAMLREAQNKRHVSQRRANRILEVRQKESAARNVQVTGLDMWREDFRGRKNVGKLQMICDP